MGRVHSQGGPTTASVVGHVQDICDDEASIICLLAVDPNTSPTSITLAESGSVVNSNIASAVDIIDKSCGLGICSVQIIDKSIRRIRALEES